MYNLFIVAKNLFKKNGGGFDLGAIGTGDFWLGGWCPGGGGGGLCPRGHLSGTIVRGGDVCPGGIWPDTIDMANSNSTMIDEACVGSAIYYDIESYVIYKITFSFIYYVHF